MTDENFYSYHPEFEAMRSQFRVIAYDPDSDLAHLSCNSKLAVTLRKHLHINGWRLTRIVGRSEVIEYSRRNPNARGTETWNQVLAVSYIPKRATLELYHARDLGEQEAMNLDFVRGALHDFSDDVRRKGGTNRIPGMSSIYHEVSEAGRVDNTTGTVN